MKFKTETLNIDRSSRIIDFMQLLIALFAIFTISLLLLGLYCLLLFNDFLSYFFLEWFRQLCQMG